MKTIAILLPVFVFGCITAETVRIEYDDRTDRTLYETERVSVLDRGSPSMGLQGKRRVSLRAVAECRGEGCIPHDVEVVFSRDGDSEVWMDVRTLTFDIDGRTFEWDGQSGREAATRILPGEFVRVSMSMNQFGRFATAQTVRGSLGGTPFRLSYLAREPLRLLLTRFGSS